MLFNKNKNKIQELESNLYFWQKTCDKLQNTINELREENKNLKNINDKLNTQIINMKQLSEENEIMRKYYKADEEPSLDIQAKILTDLRLHDMEFKILQEKINECRKEIAVNKILSSFPMYFPRYY